MRRAVLLTAVIAAMLASGLDAPMWASDSDAWEVLALGPHDEPIPGVLLPLKGATKPSAETDRNGRATLTAPKDGSTLSVFVGGTVGYEWRDVVGPKTVLRFPDTIPVDVVVVDARTGRPLTVPAMSLSRVDATPFALEATGPSHRLGAGLAHAGDSFWESFIVTPPPGYVTTDAGGCWTGQRVAGTARLGRIEIPAWSAGKLRLHVVDPRGVPVRGKIMTKITVAGVWLATSELTLDDAGRATVDAVPLVGRGWIAIEIFGTRRMKAAIRLQPDLAEYDAELVLPDKSATESGGCGGASGFCERSPMPDGGKGRLEIRAFRHDGAPARRAAILIKTGEWDKTVRADDRGIVTMDDIATNFGDIEMKQLEVQFIEPGIVPATMKVTLSPNERAVVELREPEGRTIEVKVVDDEGAPVPWARVSASQETRPYLNERWSYALVDGDVQDLSPHTDADGRFVFRNLPPGQVEIWVEFGERIVRKKVGAESAATIVLPR